MKSDFVNVVCELDNILNKRKRYISICVRLGKIKYEWDIN